MSEEGIYQKFIDHKICVLIPTYNNEQTLKSVIDSVLEFTTNVLVVNDGSTDSTSQILSNYNNIKVLSYEQNQGKGFALRTGFTEAVNLGYDYAITIDSDGQHFAKDLPVFIKKLEEVGPCLIIGARNMNQESVPTKSSFGNKFSTFWFWAETFQKVPDTQSGYRLYPVALMKNMKFFTKKFEFEIESIVRASWKGILVTSVPVSVFYAPKETRITHFRPLKDFTRISILNTVLVLIAALYIHPRNFIVPWFKKSTYQQIKHEVLYSNTSNIITSVSVAFGIFMGIVPFWGFQLIIGIAVAVYFRLNKLLFILFAHISIPPMIPLIIYISFKIGTIWMGSKASHVLFSRNISLETIKINVIQYTLGAITFATVAAIIAGLTTYFVLLTYKKNMVKQ
jgi:glycosyltransferase involved in cell wall biosynthesis